MVSGAVALTDALLGKGLPDMEPDTVAAYLREELHWRVQGVCFSFLSFLLFFFGAVTNLCGIG